jgi:hypothetical protein
MQVKNPKLLIGGLALSAFLLLQPVTPAFAFSTTVSSGELVTLTSAQLTDIRNACLSLGLGGSSFCKSVAQKSVAAKETGSAGLVVTVKETKGKRFSSTLAGAVVGATVYGAEFETLAGDGSFSGPADPNHLVPTSWGAVYFKSGQKSNLVPMTIRITVDTAPPVPPGSMSGTVTSSGSPVKGAIVVATMQNIPAVSGQSATDAAGRYVIPNLPPGTYDVDASASSYETLTANGILVEAGTDTPVHIALILLPCADRPVKDFLGVGFIDKLLGRRESGGESSTTDYVAESMRYIKQNGFNAIRVPYYWESHVYNPTEFMDRIEFIAQSAEQNGICVFFVNFHYYTTSYWNLDIEGKSPGRGFPSFVVQEFPPISNDYIQTAGPFWDAYLSNSILIDGRTVWDVQADFIKSIISRVDQYESVAGYEILNEPHFFDESHYDLAGDYHTFMANEIREVSDKKIFFDRESTWGFTRDPSLETKVAPRGVSGIVYAPHLYAIPYPGSQAEDQINNFKTWSEQWGSEVLIGELAPDTEADAEMVLQVLKENEFGWTVWSWRPIQGSGLDNSYYESETVEATEALKILLAAVAKVY